MSPGFILIDKPAGITSHDVIDRLRRVTGEKRIGHAGTLDPFATGLLLVGVGREATREMQKLVGLDKTYETTFVLGASSTTDDVTGNITKGQGVREKGLDERKIKQTLKTFIGEIDQVPPTYAAIKVGGKKLYELARAGKPTLVAPRRVTIYSIKIIKNIKDESSERKTPSAKRGEIGDGAVFNNTATSQWGPTTQQSKEFRLELNIHCSSGTYIRSIARDLGKKLGVGGYVETLRRTSIGPFSIEKAIPLSLLTANNWKETIIPIQSILANL